MTSNFYFAQGRKLNTRKPNKKTQKEKQFQNIKLSHYKKLSVHVNIFNLRYLSNLTHNSNSWQNWR